MEYAVNYNDLETFKACVQWLIEEYGSYIEVVKNYVYVGLACLILLVLLRFIDGFLFQNLR